MPVWRKIRDNPPLASKEDFLVRDELGDVYLVYCHDYKEGMDLDYVDLISEDSRFCLLDFDYWAPLPPFDGDT